MKYIEFGIGNTWFVRTEMEQPDGTETEAKGIIRPVKFRSVYLRVWIRRTVWIADSREGFKRMQKTSSRFKFILGIRSEL
ncbi:DUF3977 family protein [Paenibacillus tritici]|uniref:DUF3977 family protein n=1 Tax=Paenibacillus tritici TaxID=1873425 RepID=A0ABX2DS56_9BACL|nr:DUF3977 family protein [Paenibacillus tritici]NQX47255.1 DUF3977 family protein [Paenibacillus tritici]QUL54493.1 DUF3977 family protein [Paenibacillus tritici]